MTTYTGGPAFPPHPDERNLTRYGMTMRDYFAAKAMQGLLANPKLANEILKNGGAVGGWIKDTAWAFADAMLKGKTK